MSIRTSVFTLVLALTPAVAEAAGPKATAAPAPPDDATVLSRLAERNRVMDAALDEQAAAGAAEAKQAADNADTELRQRQDADEKTRTDRLSEEHHATVRRRRVIATVIGGAGLALVAGGVACALVSSSKQSEIQTGGFATGADIDSAASTATTTQGLSYALIPIGGAVFLTGLALFIFVPSAHSTASGSVQLRDGALAW